MVTITIFIVIITVCHFSTPADTHGEHVVHVLLRSAYLVPIISAGIWFRLKGGGLTAAIVSIIYGTHIWTSWSGQPMENTNQVAMIAVYLIVGLTTGLLSSWEHIERRKRKETETRLHRESLINALEGLSRALKWRDEYTQRHSENVAKLSVAMARRLRFGEDQTDALRLAARVHDIGKIGVCDDILKKPEQLTPTEREIIEKHPEVAADILRPIAGAEDVAEIVLAHHECPDGSGYPKGLLLHEIPPEALILSTADVYSALTEDRPYHQGMSPREALNFMESLTPHRLASYAVDTLEQVLSSSINERYDRQTPEAERKGERLVSLDDYQISPLGQHR